MKAPDKAYVAAQWHPNEKKSELYASYEKTSHPHEEVFIRKNALLDWVEKKKKFLIDSDVTEDRKVVALTVLNSLIVQLNLF